MKDEGSSNESLDGRLHREIEGAYQQAIRLPENNQLVILPSSGSSGFGHKEGEQHHEELNTSVVPFTSEVSLPKREQGLFGPDGPHVDTSSMTDGEKAMATLMCHAVSKMDKLEKRWTGSTLSPRRPSVWTQPHGKTTCPWSISKPQFSSTRAA